MAIAVGQHTKVAAASVGTTQTTGALTTAATGSTFVVGATWFDTTALAATPITDSKGNSYTIIQSVFTGSGGLANLKVGLFYCQNGTGGSGHTFSANWVTGANFAGTFVLEITGGLTSGILDQSVAGTEDTSSPYTSNTSSATGQANELIFAFASTESSSGTETLDWTANGFTQLDQASNADATVTGATAYKIVSATGTFQSSVTSSGAGTTGALSILATFKDITAGGAATGDPIEGAAQRQLRQNAIYRMSPRSEREAQQFLRAQKRAYGFAAAA